MKIKINTKKELEELIISLNENYENFNDKYDYSSITDMSDLFFFSDIKTIPLLDTRNVTDMSNMFRCCGNLETIPLFDTRNVTDMSFMFGECKNLKTIPLLDTSNVTDMNNMFYNCENLETIPLLDTSNVTNMKDMFCNCEKYKETNKIKNKKDFYNKYKYEDLISL